MLREVFQTNLPQEAVFITAAIFITSLAVFSYAQVISFLTLNMRTCYYATLLGDDPSKFQLFLDR